MLALLLAMTLAPADLACTTDKDCAYVGVGKKPCGGPASYLVYSKRGKRAAGILRDAAASTKAAEEELARSPSFGVCVMTPEPQVSCMKKVCVTKPAARASAPAPPAR